MSVLITDKGHVPGCDCPSMSSKSTGASHLIRSVSGTFEKRLSLRSFTIRSDARRGRASRTSSPQKRVGREAPVNLPAATTSKEGLEWIFAIIVAGEVGSHLVHDFSEQPGG